MLLRRRDFIFLVPALSALPACVSNSETSIKRDLAALPLTTAVRCEWYRTGDVVVARNDSEPMPAASLLKLLIAIAAANAGASGKIPPEDPFPIPGAHTPKRSWNHNGFATLPQLLSAMISQSDNFAANALIEILSINYINQVAANAGLKITRIHGTFVNTSRRIPPRSFTSANEIIKILRHIIRHRQSPTAAESFLFDLIVQDMLVQSDRRMIPAGVSDMQVADKPGELVDVLNDCAIVAPKAPNPLLLTILVRGTPPYTDYDRYARTISNIAQLAKDVASDAFKSGSPS